MEIHDLNEGALQSTDYIAIDDGSDTRKLDFGALMGTTDISGIGNGTVTDAIDTLNGKLTVTRTDITTFYSSRCENETSETTAIYNVGSVYVASIAIKMLVTPSSSQTSIFALPAGILAPSKNVYGTIFNKTTKNTHVLQVSSNGNINVLNRGEVSTNDNLEGQIIWIA